MEKFNKLMDEINESTMAKEKAQRSKIRQTIEKLRKVDPEQEIERIRKLSEREGENLQAQTWNKIAEKYLTPNHAAEEDKQPVIPAPLLSRNATVPKTQATTSTDLEFDCKCTPKSKPAKETPPASEVIQP